MSDSSFPTRSFVEDVWQYERSLVTDGYDRALDRLTDYVDGDLTVHTVPSGTDVWTWEVPPKWEVESAFVADAGTGETLVEYDHPLRVVTYSDPVDRVVDRETLYEHLHWDEQYVMNGEEIPAHEDAIPYVTAFYDDDWGFCVRESELDRFDGIEEFHVRIDATFERGALSVGEYTVEGSSDERVLLSAHLDHPGQVNDDLSGVAVGVEVLNELRGTDPTYTYTLLVVPETIGSIAFFSQHEAWIDEVACGLFLEMLGTEGDLALQHSYQGDATIDRVAEHVLDHRGDPYTTGAFRQVIGNDEMVTNGPGVEIPTISLSRWPYDEYHTSLDTPAILSDEHLRDAVEVVLDIVDVLERDRVPVRQFTGPVFLSGTGLWDTWGGRGEIREKVEYITMCLDGDHTVFEIAANHDLPFDTVDEFLSDLEAVDLLEFEDVRVDRAG